MENDLYTLALSHYQKGEYEDAFNLLKTFDVKGSASNKERVLLEACKKTDFRAILFPYRQSYIPTGIS